MEINRNHSWDNNHREGEGAGVRYLTIDLYSLSYAFDVYPIPSNMLSFQIRSTCRSLPIQFVWSVLKQRCLNIEWCLTFNWRTSRDSSSHYYSIRDSCQSFLRSILFNCNSNQSSTVSLVFKHFSFVRGQRWQWRTMSRIDSIPVGSTMSSLDDSSWRHRLMVTIQMECHAIVFWNHSYPIMTFSLS